MLSTFKFAPFSDVDDMPGMRQFQDVVNRFFEPGMRPWTPPMDIFETENELVMRMDVPDINMQDVDIRMENDTLTIRGERKFDQAQGTAHRIERSYGTFARSFSLPKSVDTEKVRADYRGGVLTITLPKKELAKPRSIKVSVTE